MPDPKVNNFNFTLLEEADTDSTAEQEDDIRCVCTICGAINKARTYLISTPDCHEWVVECTSCGAADDVVDEPDNDVVNLALLVQELREEIVKLKGDKED